jgi:hypothetical protein
MGFNLGFKGLILKRMLNTISTQMKGIIHGFKTIFYLNYNPIIVTIKMFTVSIYTSKHSKSKALL